MYRFFATSCGYATLMGKALIMPPSGGLGTGGFSEESGACVLGVDVGPGYSLCTDDDQMNTAAAKEQSKTLNEQASVAMAPKLRIQ